MYTEAAVHKGTLIWHTGSHRVNIKLGGDNPLLYIDTGAPSYVEVVQSQIYITCMCTKN